jgi:hypothetical protein
VAAEDAEARLEQLVDQVVAKSGASMTRERAYAEMLKSAEGRAAYAAYMDDYYEIATLRDPSGQVMRAAGRGDGRVEKAASAMDTITAKAKALMARSPGMTLEKAVEAVCRAEPDLYAAYENHVRGASSGGGRAASAIEGPDAARSRLVRKTERVQLSPAAERFVSDFEQWLREPGGRVEKTFEADGRLKSIRYVPAGDEAEVAEVAKADDDSALDRLLDELGLGA